MNTLQISDIAPPPLPPDDQLQAFKVKVKQWLTIDEEIAKLETRIRELRRAKNKQLEPEITAFMRQYNVSDLNTNNGKIRCNERHTKQTLNKQNIRENLLQVMTNETQVDQAMGLILNNREVKTTFHLIKPKR
jgi:recombinational DNA repair ATPase RecF